MKTSSKTQSLLSLSVDLQNPHAESLQELSGDDLLDLAIAEAREVCASSSYEGIHLDIGDVIEVVHESLLKPQRRQSL